MRRGDVVRIESAISKENDLAIVINIDDTYNNILIVPLYNSSDDAKKNFPKSMVLKETDYINSTVAEERIAVFERIMTLSSKECQIVDSVSSKALDLSLRKFAELATSLYYKEFHQNKDFKKGETKINYSGRVYDEKEMCSLVNSALDFWLTAGPFAGKFESLICNYFDAKKFYLVNSGSSANLVMVSALCSKKFDDHLVPGDEIITPAVTFPTTLAPIVQNNLVPVLVDCEIDTYNIDPKLIEPAIGPKTKAIFVAHTLGNPCDMESIMEIATKHNLIVIEDVCDAYGATFNDRLVGTFGAMASLSFYPAHHMTMGEGGGVLINDNRFKNIAVSIRDWGRDCWCEPGSNDTCNKRFKGQWGKLPFGYDHKYVYSNIGYNLKATDMQAAIGVEQFGKVDSFIEARRQNFNYYYDNLKSYSEKIMLARWERMANPSWFGFPIMVREGIDINQLILHLEDARVETRKIFAGNVLFQPAFMDIDHRVFGELSNTNKIMEHSFFIGVYPGLTREQMDYVLEVFAEFLD